ncbi:hypothetical protein H257_19184, partial [Aphanomyces astaci]
HKSSAIKPPTAKCVQPPTDCTRMSSTATLQSTAPHRPAMSVSTELNHANDSTARSSLPMALVMMALFSSETKAGTMPLQATILQNLRGKKAMGVFNLPKYFWQFPLHPDSWDMLLLFMLNECVYTPDWVMQELVDSAHIDDIFVYADTVEEYVDVLESFFDRVAQYGFKLSPAKTILLTD